jgi:hypothetical protein
MLRAVARVPCAVCRVLALNHHNLRRRGVAAYDKCALRQAAARGIWTRINPRNRRENILAKDALREAWCYVVDFMDKVMDNGFNTLINSFLFSDNGAFNAYQTNVFPTSCDP